jgi:hypothetical protein
MALQRRGEYWYGDSPEDIRALLDRHVETGDPIKVIRDVVCECGGTVFSIHLDDEYQEAAWFCRECDSQHLFHTRRVADPYEGDPEADTECCNCPCTTRGGSYFELAVGLSLYDGSDDVDWVFVACRCVACGLTGYLASWHRIEYPYPELFAHMDNKQEA